jgi:xanthine dehydrogenase accessory factor
LVSSEPARTPESVDMNVLIRGGGDIASGVALRLHRCGYRVLITELAQPVAVRRTVSFSETVYEGHWKVEDVSAQKADSDAEVEELLQNDIIPVLVAPDINSVSLNYSILIDARLTKKVEKYSLSSHTFIIGLGPGFTAGVNCHAAIETNRGHTLGRVYWEGSTLPDTSTPEGDPRRVLRAPAAGIITSYVEIGQHVEGGQEVASVAGELVISPFKGIVRGMIRPGLMVGNGLKIGDIDSRDDLNLCKLVSDKALAVGGGVLEAILNRKK